MKTMHSTAPASLSRRLRVPPPELLLLLLSLLLFTACGDRDRVISKEETGEPNTVPEEIQRYREARSVFRTWVQLFHRPRDAKGAYPLMTAESRRRLAARGVEDAAAFSAWAEEQETKSLPPFTYEFSRFDILDIDVRDTSRAVITATFLVHVRQSTFESVSSFILERERGAWRVPFAESGNFETSWWQKEKNFLSRMRIEGMTEFTSDSLGVTFSYPRSWDLSAGMQLAFADRPPQRGIELRYLDPSTMSTAAFIRIAALPPSDTDSLVVADSTAGGALQVLASDPVHLDDTVPMHARQTVLRDPLSGRRVLFLAGVADGEDDMVRFAETFRAVRNSILFTNEQIP